MATALVGAGMCSQTRIWEDFDRKKSVCGKAGILWTPDINSLSIRRNSVETFQSKPNALHLSSICLENLD